MRDRVERVGHHSFIVATIVRFLSRRSLLVVALVLLAIGPLVACGEDKSAGLNQDICKTNVTTAISEATGALTLVGNFYSDETVILRSTAGGDTRQATGTPATDRTALTLTGLPSDTTSYQLIVSCEAGQENNGTHSYFVH